ncbi:hypothetical protein LTR97_011432 [Elasticomyces elasticus]|uniref:MYND-type domain-containing protein n=1 Tax=Elasticomyces elasticus TaxID=574655 RepID=A0AAN7ZVM8_9PEZI|nr:hypothetical protein LTR97_011432 [Elasticomyces elasticus]
MERMMATSMGSPTADVNVKACNGCKRARYCSKACQVKAWKTEHKYQCKTLKHVDVVEPTRIVHKLLKRLQAGDQDVEAVLRFQSKQDDVKAQWPEHYDRLREAGAAAWRNCDEPDDIQDGLETAVSLSFNIMTNCLSLFDAGTATERLGRGFDPVLCTANHSCDPNAFFVFDTPTAVFRAGRIIVSNRTRELYHLVSACLGLGFRQLVLEIRGDGVAYFTEREASCQSGTICTDILALHAAGDEIFISYKPSTNPFRYRQAELKQFYYFECRCSKCAQGDTLDGFNKLPEDLDFHWCARADAMMQQQAREDVEMSRYWVNNSVAGRRVSALQADVFRRHQHGAQTNSVNELKSALRTCLESGMWLLKREPVPGILRDLQSAYTTSRMLLPSFLIALKRHFVVNLELHPGSVDHFQLLSSYSVMHLALGMSDPNEAQNLREMEQHFKLRLLPMAMAIQLSEQVPLSVGWDSDMGHRVRHACNQLFAPSGGTPPASLTRQLNALWPEVRAYAERIDLLEVINRAR